MTDRIDSLDIFVSYIKNQLRFRKTVFIIEKCPGHPSVTFFNFFEDFPKSRRKSVKFHILKQKVKHKFSGPKTVSIDFELLEK